MKGVPSIMISVALTWFMAGPGPVGTQQTFIGEISDGPCALNVHSQTHSHQEMSESKSMVITPSNARSFASRISTDNMYCCRRQIRRQMYTVSTTCPNDDKKFGRDSYLSPMFFGHAEIVSSGWQIHPR